MFWLTSTLKDPLSLADSVGLPSFLGALKIHFFSGDHPHMGSHCSAIVLLGFIFSWIFDISYMSDGFEPIFIFVPISRLD